MQMRSFRAWHTDLATTPYGRYLATGHLILVLTSVALFGCRDTTAPIAPPETRPKPERPSYDVYGCTLAAAVCAKIDSAITALQTDLDSYCRAAGDQARSRFVSTVPGIGFEESNDPGIYAKVTPMYMNTNPSNYVADGMTMINVAKMTVDGYWDTFSLERTIAHEEYHHYGYSPYHSQWDENWQAPGPPPPPCDLAQFNWP